MQTSYAISGSVGAGGANRAADVRVVQLLLNGWLGQTGRLAVDGVAGPLTTAQILRFQQAARVPTADSRIDPSGPTLRALTAAALAGLATGVRPYNEFAAAAAAESEPDPSMPDLGAALRLSLAAYRARGE